MICRMIWGRPLLGLPNRSRFHLLQADNLTSLSSFLMTIRRPYLDLSSSSSHGPSSSKPSAGKGLSVFENARSLSDRDRDEVDLQVKVILKRCMERVREMEGFEKGGLHPDFNSGGIYLIALMFPIRAYSADSENETPGIRWGE